MTGPGLGRFGFKGDDHTHCCPIVFFYQEATIAAAYHGCTMGADSHIGLYHTSSSAHLLTPLVEFPTDFPSKFDMLLNGIDTHFLGKLVTSKITAIFANSILCWHIVLIGCNRV
jgi:hypothetical protein